MLEHSALEQMDVIPAKAGIHFDLTVDLRGKWIPAFAGMTSVVEGGRGLEVSRRCCIRTVNA
jgi:hypothetical protein